MTITKQEVEAAFEIGGYTINERFPECGFIYFPTCHPYTKDNPEQGRVFWKLNVPAGFEPITRADIHINESWSYPNPVQASQLYDLVEVYVNYCRQERIEKRIACP